MNISTNCYSATKAPPRSHLNHQEAIFKAVPGGYALCIGSAPAEAVSGCFAPLVRVTESSSPPPPISVSGFTGFSNTSNKSLLWNKKQEIEELIKNEGLKAKLRYPRSWHQSGLCMRQSVAFGGLVAIKKNQRSFYAGLLVCSKIWVCPVCQAKIMEERRKEIDKAMFFIKSEKFGKSKNLQACMITFTFSHNKNQTLKELLEKQKEAFEIFRSGKAWTNFKNKSGFFGLIRSLEITYSNANGWHPHTHELHFVNKDLDQKEFTDFIKTRWYNCLVKVGLISDSQEDKEKTFARSVDIKFNATSGDYISKMDKSLDQKFDIEKKHKGVDYEMANGLYKNTRGKASLQPFDLVSKNPEKFLEYIKATKGKAKIYWSTGLKELMEIQEQLDSEIAEKEPEKSKLVAMITPSQWKIGVDYRPELLYIAQNTKDILQARREINEFIESKNIKKIHLRYFYDYESLEEIEQGSPF